MVLCLPYSGSPQGERLAMTTSSKFLVDNPIYKTSTASLVSSSENGLQSRNRTLRTVGSEVSCDASPPSRCSSTSKLTADNPQYATHLAPPPTQKPPRYIKVNSVAEPMYELIKTSERGTDGVTVLANTPSDVDGSSGNNNGGEPVYSTPNKVKRDSTVPLYESTMDIPAAVGADGAPYAKLNHKQSHTQLSI